MRKARLIIGYECLNHGITQKELREGGRTKTLSQIRRQIIMRLRKETELSWREIGSLVGLTSKPTKQYASGDQQKSG